MVQEIALGILRAVSVRWPGHADVVRSVCEHLDGRLADLEPEALVVRDIRRIRGVQVTGQASLVGESECGGSSCLPTPRRWARGWTPMACKYQDLSRG